MNDTRDAAPATPKKRTNIHAQDSDRNFDDLAHRFKRNVYDSLKGEIRLAILERDFLEYCPELYQTQALEPLRILDAGGGQGQFSLRLAQFGHQVVICDLSAEMLSLARQEAQRLGVEERVTLVHESIQSFLARSQEPFDMVLCHAVLEWVVEPEALLVHLLKGLKPGGWLSLTYYNINSIKMKNLLRGNFQKVADEDLCGSQGSLTPAFPRDPEQVEVWLSGLPLEPVCRSGIRCFHDYLLNPAVRDKETPLQLQLEKQFSRQEPWRSLARYLHVLSRKSLA